MVICESFSPLFICLSMKKLVSTQKSNKNIFYTILSVIIGGIFYFNLRKIVEFDELYTPKEFFLALIKIIFVTALYVWSFFWIILILLIIFLASFFYVKENKKIILLINYITQKFPKKFKHIARFFSLFIITAVFLIIILLVMVFVSHALSYFEPYGF